MSRLIDYTTNASLGIQLSTDMMKMSQDEMQSLITSYKETIGDDSIVQGAVGTASVYTAGHVVLNGEFYYFIGGAFDNYLKVNEVVTSLIHSVGAAVHPVYTVRTLEFAATATGETWAITDVDGFNIMTRPDSNKTLTAGVASNTGLIGVNETAINTEASDRGVADTALQVQIDALTAAIAAIDLDEVGDVKYVTNITNFDANGNGVVATNRENWALVHASNSNWSTALGYAGTYANFQKRVLAIAGSTYALLDEFGTDDHTLTTAELASHDHTGTNDAAGAHTPVVNLNNGPGSTYEVPVYSQTDTLLTTTDAVVPEIDHQHTFTTDASGSGDAHENRQPSIALHLMVKYA